MAERHAALLLNTIDSAAAQIFEQSGYDVATFPPGLSTDQLIRELNDTGAEILGVRTSPKLPGRVFEEAPDLYAVGCYSVGTGHIDLKAATREGAAVFNAPYDNGRSVAEWAIITAGVIRRRLGVFNAQMHKGIFKKRVEDCREMRGSTVGIIGYGNIGMQLSSLAEAFGMNVIYFDRDPRPEYGRAKRMRRLEDLLLQCDIVSVHVPGGQDGPVLGRRELEMLPEGALVINSARAEAVDNQALKELILSGRLGGAAIDVHDDEPSANTDDFRSIFAGMEDKNVFMTPHVAGNTEESLARAARSVTELLLDYAATGSSTGAVNLPQVKTKPKANNVIRVTSIHPPTAGEANAILSPLADAGISAAHAEIEDTRDVGYMILDIRNTPGMADRVHDALRDVRGRTGRRLRVIGATAVAKVDK